MSRLPRVVGGSLVAILVGSVPASAEEPEKITEKAAGRVAEHAEKIVFSFGADLRALPRRVLDDFTSLAEPSNLAILAASGGGAAVSREEWDDDVREEVTEQPQRFGRTFNHFLDNSGASYNHVAGVAAAYGASLFLQSPVLHELSLDAAHALMLEIPLVIGLKKAFDTRRPNRESEGFPSGHVASTFALAAVAHENLGLFPGLLGYSWGSLVALHRIDAGHHDLSDTIFGAGIGIAAGFAAAGHVAPELAGVEVKPWMDASSGAKGVGFEIRF